MMYKILFFMLFACVSNAYATCPAGYYTLESNAATSLAASCPSGYVDIGEISVCDGTPVRCWGEYKCNAGVSRIKTSTGIDTPLYGVKVSSPAFHVQVGDKICYGNLASGTASPAINMNFNGQTYHISSVHECVSWGATSCTVNDVQEYTMNFAGQCGAIDVHGVSICEDSKGFQQYSTRQDAWVVTYENENKANRNCWCRILSPAVSWWVYIKSMDTVKDCYQSCAIECANELKTSAAFRQALGETFGKY